MEFNEKNSKYISALEKKHAETEIINRLKEKNKILTDQAEILQAINHSTAIFTVKKNVTQQMTLFSKTQTKH